MTRMGSHTWPFWSLTLSLLVLFIVTLGNVNSTFAMEEKITENSNATQQQSYYDILQVSQEADAGAIKKAYRRLALQYHPDTSASGDKDNNAELFIQLARAYEILSDPTMKARYDYLLTKEGKYEYEERDWRYFDPTTLSFRTSITFGHGRFHFKFSSANDVFSKNEEDLLKEEEREKRAILIAFTVALLVAFAPTIYFWNEKRVAALERKRKTEIANKKLRDDQALVAEFQKEQKLEEERERKLAFELRKLERERAELENESENEEDTESRRESNEQDASESEDIDSKDSKVSRSNNQIHRCDLCRKSFKSDAQYENHCNSNQHKRAEKDSELAKKKQQKKK